MKNKKVDSAETRRMSRDMFKQEGCRTMGTQTIKDVTKYTRKTKHKVRF
jgi:hypothetical protein